MGDGEPCTVVAAAEMHAAKAVATTEMHAAKAVPSAMTTAEMSATAVTTSRQRRTRQQAATTRMAIPMRDCDMLSAPASLSAPAFRLPKRRREEPKVPRAKVRFRHTRRAVRPCERK